jgi:hypothetical protein
MQTVPQDLCAQGHINDGPTVGLRKYPTSTTQMVSKLQCRTFCLRYCVYI